MSEILTEDNSVPNPGKKKPGNHYRKKKRERYFAKKVPNVQEVLAATSLDVNLAPVIKQIIILRLVNGITTGEMATACNVSLQNYRLIESGDRLPTLSLLLRMAYVVGGRIELVGWTEKFRPD